MGKNKKRHPLLHEVYNMGSVILGAILVAIGLEMFLVPNNFLDGGVVGVGIILTNYIKLPLGVFIAVLNIPFVALTWIKLGRRTALRTVVGIGTLAISTVILHHHDAWTDEYVLALGYGGLLLGLGVGLALRAGGALDGTEALASLVSTKSSWSVDQIILYINIGIFTTAAFVISPESAMSSALLFYVVVAPIIRKVVDGDTDMKLVEIVTDKPSEVIENVHRESKRRIVTYKSKAILRDGTLGEVIVVKLLVSRMEETFIGDLVLEVDPDASIIFKEVSHVRGGAFENNGTH